jgi:hypothetical protein
VLFLASFQRIQNQREFLRFYIFLDFLPTKFCGVILALFDNFEAKRAKNGSKTFLVNVS